MNFFTYLKYLYFLFYFLFKFVLDITLNFDISTKLTSKRSRNILLKGKKYKIMGLNKPNPYDKKNDKYLNFLFFFHLFLLFLPSLQSK